MFIPGVHVFGFRGLAGGGMASLPTQCGVRSVRSHPGVALRARIPGDHWSGGPEGRFSNHPAGWVGKAWAPRVGMGGLAMPPARGCLRRCSVQGRDCGRGGPQVGNASTPVALTGHVQKLEVGPLVDNSAGTAVLGDHHLCAREGIFAGRLRWPAEDESTCARLHFVWHGGP